MPRSETYRDIYRIVSLIPPGRVATYGQIARLAGMPGHARQVGYALCSLVDKAVPWQRVVNARGEISRRSSGGPAENEQHLRLEAEGVEFDAGGRIPLDRYLWKP
jgi:methylated-DNA-protein-cysteine methyltransferase-like protein